MIHFAIPLVAYPVRYRMFLVNVFEDPLRWPDFARLSIKGKKSQLSYPRSFNWPAEASHMWLF